MISYSFFSQGGMQIGGHGDQVVQRVLARLAVGQSYSGLVSAAHEIDPADPTVTLISCLLAGHTTLAAVFKDVVTETAPFSYLAMTVAPVDLQPTQDSPRVFLQRRLIELTEAYTYRRYGAKPVFPDDDDSIVVTIYRDPVRGVFTTVATPNVQPVAHYAVRVMSLTRQEAHSISVLPLTLAPGRDRPLIMEMKRINDALKHK